MSQNKKERRRKVQLFKPKRKKNAEDDAAIQYLTSQYVKIVSDEVHTFKDFPLSQKTQKGLKECNYIKLTEIQKQTIGLALQDKDILGAAKTGSGKTLAFLIPILEKLFCQKWTRLDGLGALIISPTRELAYQIYATLRKIGVYHDFSAGLIIGGQNLKFERKRMDQVNILICTPGRLLQHMDENPLFDCNNLQILVLDEADRCLDLGFEETMNGIIENLPIKRQTLLFSATQTKSIKDLARLSLSHPSYVAPHEKSETTTPTALQQSYIVCNIDEKLGILWSFIKNHLKQKVLVFMSTCKQVKYFYETFCKLRPGISLLALYGTLHQEKREKIYNEFCRKSNVVLFATDLASRGLDFPQVNWVIQMDCPEDVETYIHRVGRTARGLLGKGEGLLMLLPPEEVIIKNLTKQKIPINKITVDPNKVVAPQRKIEALLSEYPDLKASAQRAFVSYLRSVCVMKNKEVFDVKTIDTDSFARSLGLIVAPRLRFLQQLKHYQQITKKNNCNLLHDNEIPETNDMTINTKVISHNSLRKDNKNNTLKNLAKVNLNFHSSGESDDEDFLQIKQKKNINLMEAPAESTNISKQESKKKKPLTKAAIAKKLMKKKIAVNTKVKFTDEGAIIPDEKGGLQSNLAKEYENENVGGIDIKKAKEVLREEDRFDKIRFKEKVRAKHKELKRKFKNKQENEGEKDDFGSESESDGPDLSWLPDPDKVYEDKSNLFEVSSYTKETDDDKVHRAPKRKLHLSKGIPQDTAKPNKKLRVSDISASLTVKEAEHLAVQLLRGKR